MRARVGSIGVTFAGWRQLVAQCGDQFVDPLPGFGGDENCIFGGETEHLFNFFRHAHGVGTGQIDLVDERE